MHGKMGPAEPKQRAGCGRREAVGDGIDLLGTEKGNSNSTEEELEDTAGSGGMDWALLFTSSSTFFVLF